MLDARRWSRHVCARERLLSNEACANGRPAVAFSAAPVVRLLAVEAAAPCGYRRATRRWPGRPCGAVARSQPLARARRMTPRSGTRAAGARARSRETIGGWARARRAASVAVPAIALARDVCRGHEAHLVWRGFTSGAAARAPLKRVGASSVAARDRGGRIRRRWSL